MPMTDALSNFRSADEGNMAATETSDPIYIGETGARGLGYWISCPQRVGSTTLDVKIQHSHTDSGSDFTDLQVMNQITAAGTYEMRINTHLPYIRRVATIGSASGAGMGAVQDGVNIGANRNVLTVGDAATAAP